MLHGGYATRGYGRGLSLFMGEWERFKPV